MKKISLEQAMAALAESPRTAKATEEDEVKLALKWARSAADHTAITALAGRCVNNGGIEDGKRFYVARVAAKAHRLFDL